VSSRREGGDSSGAAPAGQSLRISPLDRPWREAETAVALGPLEMPSLGDLRSAFVELAALGASTRAGYTFDAGRRSWLFDPGRLTELSEQVVTAVESPHLPPQASEEEVIAALENLISAGTASSPSPLLLERAGSALIQRQNHAFGDAQALLRLPAAVLQVASTGQLPKWVEESLAVHPAWSALRNVLTDGRRPMGNLIRDRASKVIRSHRDPGDGVLTPWTPQLKVVFRVFSRASWDQVQQWRRAHAPKASMASVYLVLLRLALREAGIPLADDTVVLYDCRRYLRAGEHVRGNFITVRSHQFSDDVVEAGATIAQTAESAQPLGTLIVAAAKRRIVPLKRTHATVSTRPLTVPAFVFAPRNGSVEASPWQRRDLHCVASANTPSSPADVTASMILVGGRLSISFSYHANVLDEALIRAAAHLMEHEAATLLESRTA